MKFFLIIGLVLMFAFSVKAQEISLNNKIKNIPGNYVYFSIDNLDNIYLLSASNQLKKLNAQGDSVSVFNDIKKFGEATLVDVSNPVKILLYYKGFATIVVLDGMLNLKTTIDLRRKGIFNVTAVGLSYDGKIWLYDEVSNTLKKIDDSGNLIFQTADFRQLFDKAITPVKIFDQNQYVFLYDSTQGIYVFDYYGAFKNKIDIRNWHYLRIIDKYIYGMDSTNICRYNMNTFKSTQWPVPAELQGYHQLFLEEKKLFGLSKNGLDIFKTSGE